MRFTVITPTLLRPTLVRTCESVDAQGVDLQHLVRIDMPVADVQPHQWQLLSTISRPGRQINFCGVHHHDFGNTCRFNAWERAQGEYLLYLDDDDYYADADALKRLDTAIPKGAVWGSYPVEAYGAHYYKRPAQTGNVFGAQLFHQKVYDGWQIRFPAEPIYSADGLLADNLHGIGAPHTALPELRPLVVIPKASHGKAPSLL